MRQLHDYLFAKPAESNGGKRAAGSYQQKTELSKEHILPTPP